MCGRFTLKTHTEHVRTLFKLDKAPTMSPRYNIAPTQPVAVVRLDASSARELAHVQWGLIPHWARDPSIGARMINARSETIADKPAFRSAFCRRRCLIPADGFYEWKKGAAGKPPVYMHMADDAPFAFAGLWEHWQGGNGSEIESCTIITVQANELLEPVHDRMPVILDAHDFDTWLAPEPADAKALCALLQPYPSDAMDVYAVSPFVNSPRNDSDRCVERAPWAAEPAGGTMIG